MSMNPNHYFFIKLIAFLFLFQTAHAQNIGTITGITKNKNNEVVVGATVLLLKAKNGLILKSAITDTDGKFEFEKLKFDTCKLTITFVGVEKYTSETFILSAAQPSIDLWTVALTPSTTELKEVSVTAQKAFVVQKIDRTVITPDALISNAGITSLEVLEKAMGVMVDMNGNISFKGKTGVMVFIDDKPSNLMVVSIWLMDKDDTAARTTASISITASINSIFSPMRVSTRTTVIKIWRLKEGILHDDYRLYKKVLTATEINTLYTFKPW